MLKLLAALVAFAGLLTFSAEVWRASEKSPQYYERYSHRSKIKGADQSQKIWEWDTLILALHFSHSVWRLSLSYRPDCSFGNCDYMRKGLEDAKIAAEGARDAAIAQTNEFLATHRPKIRIKHLTLAEDIWHGEPIVVHLTCVNTGTTEAILAELGLRYEIVKKGRALAMNPAIPAIFNYGGRKLACGRNWTTNNINTNKILTSKENDAIQKGEAELYCIGYVSYLDTSGRMRITGFCRALTFPEDALADVLHCRFRVSDDPDYEYED